MQCRLIEETSWSLETDGESILRSSAPGSLCARDAAEERSCFAACLVGGIEKKKLEASSSISLDSGYCV